MGERGIGDGKKRGEGVDRESKIKLDLAWLGLAGRGTAWLGAGRARLREISLNGLHAALCMRRVFPSEALWARKMARIHVMMLR